MMDNYFQCCEEFSNENKFNQQIISLLAIKMMSQAMAPITTIKQSAESCSDKATIKEAP